MKDLTIALAAVLVLAACAAPKKIQPPRKGQGYVYYPSEAGVTLVITTKDDEAARGRAIEELCKPCIVTEGFELTILEPLK